ncbi:MAG: RNA methyltransferase [Acidobacteriota bacterium]
MAPLRFVLVRPRTPANVGSVARAMKNFGFQDLILVDPRLHRSQDLPGSPPLFETESRRTAWGAVDVLGAARTVGSLEEAVAGCQVVLATAPHAHAKLPTLTPEAAADRVGRPGVDAALVFGSESSGLTLRELSACGRVVVIPTDPAYRDLNVAQSAVLLAYLAFRAGGGAAPAAAPEPANHEQVEAAAQQLLNVAERIRFLRHPGAPVGRELRSMLHRFGLSRREVGLIRSFLRRLAPHLPRASE